MRAWHAGFEVEGEVLGQKTGREEGSWGGRAEKCGQGQDWGKGPLVSSLPTCSGGPRVPRLAAGRSIFSRVLGQPASNTPSSPSACFSYLLPIPGTAQPNLHRFVPHSCYRSPPGGHSVLFLASGSSKELGKRAVGKPKPAGWALRGFRPQNGAGRVTSLLLHDVSPPGSLDFPGASSAAAVVLRRGGRPDLGQLWRASAGDF